MVHLYRWTNGHRIGQRAKVVRVRKFVTENTVEEKIVQLQPTQNTNGKWYP